MSSQTLIKMRARVVTDGNPEDERDKTTRHPANPNQILQAKTLQAAIEYFATETGYIDYVTRFDYFEIDGIRYYSEHWVED